MIAPDDFLEWLSSPKGQISEEALFDVHDALKDASVDLKQRKIVWKDGAQLSIRDTAKRIHKRHPKLPLKKIHSHVIGWLEMDYEPKGLYGDQMDEFETLIGEWIDEENLDSI